MMFCSNDIENWLILWIIFLLFIFPVYFNSVIRIYFSLQDNNSELRRVTVYEIMFQMYETEIILSAV